MRSWDFWDTLVTRTVISPSEIFNLVEIDSKIPRFSEERILAEANSRIGVGETTLDRIYDFLPFSAQEKKILKEAEIRIEILMSSPIKENIKRFQRGDCIISDMYLSREVLFRIAEKCDIPVQIDQIFVSSEYQNTKHEGRLFDDVQMLKKIVRHCGDNKRSDVLIPRSRNISAEHYLGSLTNSLEKVWQIQAGDGEYFSGLLRSARLANTDRDDEWSIYVQILAPVLVQFVEWVLQDALDRGIKKIFFLSRDGQILCEIANKLSRSRGYAIDCIYLYVSRQALHLPGHISVDISESWLLDNTSILTLRIISERAGIECEKLYLISSRYINSLPDENLTVEQRKKLRFLIRDKDFVALLNKSSSAALDLASEYLKQEGLISNDFENKAIVDVGWNGRMQRSIDCIFSKLSISSEILHGYYVGLSESCVYENGARVHGFIFDPFTPSKKDGRWIDNYRGMMEFFLEADHPSVHGYKKNEHGIIKPFFLNDINSDSLSRVKFKHDAIKTYAKIYTELSICLKRPLVDINEFAIFRLKFLLGNPKLKQVLPFIGCEHTEQQVESFFVPIICKLSPLNIVFQKRNMAIWIEGSCKFSGFLWLLRFRRILSILKISLVNKLICYFPIINHCKKAEK